MEDESEEANKRVIDESQKEEYFFRVVDHSNANSKCLQLTKTKLSINDISTVSIMAKYRKGRKIQETLITKVPTFLWDCSVPLYHCISDKEADRIGNNEVFRKSGSRKRMKEFMDRHHDMHVRGCSFDQSGLSNLDIAGLMKTFIREKLEPIFLKDDATLTDMEDLLGQDKGISFDIDTYPELGTFLFAIKFLHGMCLKDPTRRLTPYNLAVVFAPSFIHDQHPRFDIESEHKVIDKHIALMQKLIENSHNLVMKEADTNRLRSNSISNGRTNNLQENRRSSSLFIRRIRGFVNRAERVKKISGISIECLQTDKVLTPEGRKARPRQKKRTPNTSIKERCDVRLSPGSVKVTQKLSNISKDYRLRRSPSESQLSPSSSSPPPVDLVEMNRYKHILQFSNSSLTTEPPGDETIYGKHTKAFDIVDAKKPPFPKLKDDEEHSLHNRGTSDHMHEINPSSSSVDVPDTFTDIQNICEITSPSDNVSYSILPDLKRATIHTTYKSSITLIPNERSAPIRRADSTENIIRADEARRKPPIPATRSSENLFKAPASPPRKTKVEEDGFKKPRAMNVNLFNAPYRLRARSQSRFDQENFGFDMASVIMGSNNIEDLDSKTNLGQSHRPSLALLKERRQVSTQVAKLEKQNSVEETRSPKWSLPKNPKPAENPSN